MILIMKTISYATRMTETSPHVLFDGTWKQALEYCAELNRKATRNLYGALRLKVVKPETEKS